MYQAETDRWSSYERVATIESSLSTYAYAGASVNAGTVDGTACAVVNGMFQDENEEVSSTCLLVKRDHNTASFAIEKLESAELDDASLVSGTIISHDSKATVFGIAETPIEDGESAIALRAYDIDLIWLYLFGQSDESPRALRGREAPCGIRSTPGSSPRSSGGR